MIKISINVFKFRDGRIASLHIYLDPDYTGDDEARFRWGKSSLVTFLDGNRMVTAAILTYESSKLCFPADLRTSNRRGRHVGLAQQHKVFAQLADHRG